MSKSRKPGIAILASGNGTTAEAFIKATQKGEVDAEVGLVICNKEDASIFGKIARLNSVYDLNIKTLLINGELFPGGRQERGQTLEEAAEICRAVNAGGYSLIVLMGYMRIIAAEGDLMKEYGWLPEYADRDPVNKGKYYCRMLNTHLGILPATADTYGRGSQERAIELGLTETAHTVHAVSAGVDAGPIVAEHRIPIMKGDTPQQLQERGQKAEKANLPRDIDQFMKSQKDVLLD